MPHPVEQFLGSGDPRSLGDKGRRLDSNQACSAQLLCLLEEDQGSPQSNMEGGGREREPFHTDKMQSCLL